MNCLQCQDQLQRQLDRDPVEETPALALHLAECNACRQLYGAAQRLEAGLRVLAEPSPARDLAERICSRLGVDRRHRRLQRIYALAATLLIAVLGGLYAWRSTPSDSAPSQIAQAPLDAPAPSLPTLQQSVSEASQAVVSLTRRTATEAVGQSRVLWEDVVSMPTSADAGMLENTLDPPARSLREAGQGVTAAIEPVTTSARRAINLFFKDLPTSF